MTLGQLKKLRFFVPAILIVIFYELFGFISGLWTLTTFDTTKIKYSPIVIFFAAIYYISPLRDIANGRHHTKVTDNLRRSIVAIGGLSDHRIFSWAKLKPLFFSLIDSDETLKKKSEIIMHNGLIWTSFADSVVISWSFMAYSAAMIYFIGPNAAYAFISFFLIFCVSAIGQHITTEKHIALSGEQIDYMSIKYKKQISDWLNQLAN